MAKYTLRKMPDLRGNNTQKVYPQLVHAGNITTAAMARALEGRTSFTTSDIKGLVEAISQYVAEQTALGYAVKIDGLGSFRATLEMPADKAEHVAENGRPNAANVQVKDVIFRSDVKLVQQVRQRIELEHEVVEAAPVLIHTREERLAAALAHITANGFLRIPDYVSITGLNRSAAVRELHALGAEGLLGTQGGGTHKVYVHP